MWQGLLFAVLQSAAPDALVVEGAVLTEDVTGSLINDYALRLDVTVSNPTDEAQCIQRSNLNGARWDVRDIETGEALEPMPDGRASQAGPGSAVQIRAGDTWVFGIDFYRFYQFEEGQRYNVVGTLATAPCELDEAGQPLWSLNVSEMGYLGVSHFPAAESESVSSGPGALEFVDSRFDGNDLFVTLRNVGDEPACIPYHELEANYVQVFDVQTGRRAESRGHAHQSRSMMHRIVPGETKDIRFQISHLFELDSMFGYRFGGSFEYAPCNEFQMNDLGFAIPIDGQASVLTYTYDPTTD